MSPTLNVKGAESGTARILGSGLSGVCAHAVLLSAVRCQHSQSLNYVGVAELVVFHPVDTIAKRLMSNKVRSHASYFCYIKLILYGLLGVIVLAFVNHLPGTCLCSSGSKTAVAVPRFGVRSWLQGYAANLQVWWSAILQRLDHEALQDRVYEHVRRA